MTLLRWRAMTTADLADVQSIADRVHISYPERPAVFAERLRLHPHGCFVLVDDAVNAVVGYTVSHPWDGAPPALDTLLGPLPQTPTTFYIHDIALLPPARGHGAVADIIERIVEDARRQRLASVGLVAVGGTAPLWCHLGFQARQDVAIAAKLASYGDDATYMVRPL
jgi:ribosomal protein S18 acetylase RimI-like enzyme